MKKLILGAAVIMLGVLAAVPGIAYAYQGDPSAQGPNCTAERHEAMEQAFENNDYNAWKEPMSGKGRVTEVITEENFARFAEAHELAENGDLDGARAIRQELGLGLGNGNGDGSGQGNRGQGFGRKGNR